MSSPANPESVLLPLVLPQAEKAAAYTPSYRESNSINTRPGAFAYGNRMENHRTNFQQPRRDHVGPYRKGMFTYQNPVSDPLSTLRNPFGIQHSWGNTGTHTSGLKATGNMVNQMFNPVAWAGAGVEDFAHGGIQAYRRFGNARRLAGSPYFSDNVAALGEAAAGVGGLGAQSLAGGSGLFTAYLSRNAPGAALNTARKVTGGLQGMAGSTEGSLWKNFKQGWGGARDTINLRRAGDMADGRRWSWTNGGSRWGIADDVVAFDKLDDTAKSKHYLSKLNPAKLEKLKQTSQYRSKILGSTGSSLRNQFALLRGGAATGPAGVNPAGKLKSLWRLARSNKRLAAPLALAAFAPALWSRSSQRDADRTQGITDQWDRLNTGPAEDNPFAELFAKLPRMASGFMQNPNQVNNVRSWYQ